MFMMIEEFKSIHILFCSFILAIIYFCWKSTQVRQHLPGVQRLPISNFVRRSSSVVSTVSSESTSEENLTSSVENITDSIFVEASESFNQARTEENVLTEEEQIIREMDRDLPTSSNQSNLRRRNVPVTDSNSTAAAVGQQNEEDKISIKLKYLSDEIKTVDCFLSETVGTFKRRQFSSELESKLIKLIFNGQILEDDKKSLSQCGLFSEAVVHCLILQKRNVNAAATSPLSAAPSISSNRRSMLTPPNPLEWNGTLYIYIAGMVLVSLTLVFCWYCRLQYSSYFSWYSTIGLILMTSLFLVMIPLLTLVGFFSHRS